MSITGWLFKASQLHTAGLKGRLYPLLSKGLSYPPLGGVLVVVSVVATEYNDQKASWGGH